MTPSPSQVLASQLLVLAKGTSSEFPILMSWLQSHQDYRAQEFWQHKDEAGQHVLFSLSHKISPDVFLKMLPTWRQEVGDDLAKTLLSTPDNKGNVLLHAAWSKRLRERYGVVECDKVVYEVMLDTDRAQWCWKDPEGAIPGSGWVSDLVALLKDNHQKNVLEKILSAVAEQFPQQQTSSSSPAQSPWLKAETKDQITALLDMGFSVNDDIQVSRLVMPAWKWILSTQSHNQQIVDVIKSADNLDDAGIVSIEKSIQEFSQLVANDRRAKKGYVEKVINQEGTDWMGRNSLNYLINYRSDLLDLWDDLTCGQKSLRVKQLMGKDLAGYSIVFHALNNGATTTHGKLVKMAEREGLDVQYGVEGLGWWVHENASKSWWKNIKRFPSDRGNVYGRKLGIMHLMDLKRPASFYWGDLEQQQTWSDWWEKSLKQLPNMVDVLAKRSKSDDVGVSVSRSLMACRQVLLFTCMSDEARQDLSPQLHSQLQFASLVMCGHASHSNEFWNQALGMSFENVKGKDNKERHLRVPSHFTPQMNALLHDPDFELPIHPYWIRGEGDQKEVLAAWTAQSEQQILEQSVGYSSASSSHRRKM